MAPLCKLVKRGAVRTNDLPLSNDLEARPDSSVCRAIVVQCQGSRVRVPLGSVIFSHFHFLFSEEIDEEKQFLLRGSTLVQLLFTLSPQKLSAERV